MDLGNMYQLFVNSMLDKSDFFFAKYAEFGRLFLNFMHLIFDKLFYVFLALLTLVSFIYLLSTIYIVFRKKEPYKELPVDESNLPLVTVQIPTRNELAAIRCAEHCLAFDYPADRYEILIGDDSNDPAVSAELAAFASQNSKVKVLKRESNVGYKAGNLNNMLKHSKGEFLVLFDSDFTPPRDFLKRIVAPMVHDKGIAGVQARWKFVNANQNTVSVLGASIVAVVHRVALPFLNKRRRISALCGSAEAVRRDVLERLGGWLNGSLTEDIEYALRLLKNGYKIQYLPDLECGSEIPYMPRDLYKQQMRWAYGVVSALRDHAKGLVFSKKLATEEKFLISYFFSGYLFTTALFFVIVFGVLGIITHEPEPVNISKFLYETGRNLLWTAGLLITAVYAMAKSGSGKKIVQIVASSLSYGLIVTYYVTVGIYKVLSGQPMPWFMLNKQGNQNQQLQQHQRSAG